MKHSPQFVVVLFAAAALVGGMPLLIAVGAPYQIATSECLVCGRMRSVDDRWLRTPVETIDESETSNWMDRHLQGHSEHWWSGCSTETRGSWFHSASIGCGGIGGVSSLQRLAQAVGPEQAEPFIERYLQLVELRDHFALVEFVRGELQPAYVEVTRQ